MSNKGVFDRICNVFRSHFSDPHLNISMDTSPKNFTKWDSINNLLLINQIEEEFKIELPIEVIFEIEKVSDIYKFLVANVK